MDVPGGEPAGAAGHLDQLGSGPGLGGVDLDDARVGGVDGGAAAHREVGAGVPVVPVPAGGAPVVPVGPDQVPRDGVGGLPGRAGEDGVTGAIPVAGPPDLAAVELDVGGDHPVVGVRQSSGGVRLGCGVGGGEDVVDGVAVVGAGGPSADRL